MVTRTAVHVKKTVLALTCLLLMVQVRSQCFRVKASSINLRALPSVSGQSLGTSANGAILTDLKRESGDKQWVLVRTSGGVQAWAKKEFLTASKCTPTSPSGATGSAPASAPAGADGCGPYGKAARQTLAGNGGIRYTVVRVQPGDLSRAGAQDNTMTVPTACGFYRLKMAARAAGHRITINSAFRTLARQQYFWNCYRTRRCNGGALAARPGTSNHGRGQALDFALTGGALSWMNRNAQRFGFVRTVRSETWHWEYIPGARKPFPY